jgi:hypothetical protein
VPAAPPLRQPGIAESADPMAAVRDAAPAPTELGGGVEPARPASTARLRAERAADELKPDRLGKTAAAGDPPERAPLPKAVPAPAAESAAPAAASPALTLLRRIRAESAVPSAQWTWQPPGAAAPRPVDADGEAWLLRLVQTARRRWVDVAVPSDAGGATEVRWWRDGEPHARLRIEAGGLRWLETSGRIRFAALEPHALERLRSY